jgi:uncharacterized membrane protein YgaE (UPF0421/DUF939 family)
MKTRSGLFLIYLAKCAAGAGLVFALEPLIGAENTPWCLVSIVLVLSPRGQDALQLATSRIKANVVGSASAMALLLIGPANAWTVAAAFGLAIALCGGFGMMAASRTALAAVAIVMLHPAAGPPWVNAWLRVTAVIGGCLSGWLITLAFHGLASTLIEQIPLSAD